MAGDTFSKVVGFFSFVYSNIFFKIKIGYIMKLYLVITISLSFIVFNIDVSGVTVEEYNCGGLKTYKLKNV